MEPSNLFSQQQPADTWWNAQGTLISTMFPRNISSTIPNLGWQMLIGWWVVNLEAFHGLAFFGVWRLTTCLMDLVGTSPIPEFLPRQNSHDAACCQKEHPFLHDFWVRREHQDYDLTASRKRSKQGTRSSANKLEARQMKPPESHGCCQKNLLRHGMDENSGARNPANVQPWTTLLLGETVWCILLSWHRCVLTSSIQFCAMLGSRFHSTYFHSDRATLAATRIPLIKVLNARCKAAGRIFKWSSQCRNVTVGEAKKTRLHQAAHHLYMFFGVKNQCKTLDIHCLLAKQYWVVNGMTETKVLSQYIAPKQHTVPGRLNLPCPAVTTLTTLITRYKI